MRLVVKFGGTSIGDGSLVRHAAHNIKREVVRGNEVVVVASAIGKTTNNLLQILNSATEGQYSPPVYDDVVAMGERTSVRILAAALESIGVKTRYFEPEKENWPIITTSDHAQAQPLMEPTRENCQRFILPLLSEGIVPVICGFLGTTPEGKITTLGRGGSDTTATIIGNCLDAELIVIVTDVEGILSGDPQVVENPYLIDKLPANVLWDLTVSGARVLKWDALHYKKPEQRLKIIHYKQHSLQAKGTEIERGKAMELEVKKLDIPLASLTLVGENLVNYTGLLAKTSKLLSDRNINILAVTVAVNSMSYFIEEAVEEEALRVLHNFVLHDKKLLSVTSQKGLGMVYIASPAFVSEPGVLGKFTTAIGEARVNIIEVTTSKSQIIAFVNYKDLEVAYEIAKLVFKKEEK